MREFEVGARPQQDFDEATKLHSSDQLEQMLRREVEQVNPDFEGSEHTMLGDLEALAQSMKLVDEAPVPVPVPTTRQSARHTVRRPSSSSPVRSTGQTPAVRALGSMTDMSKPAFKQDDDAFEPWDDIDAEPVQAAPAPEPATRRPITAPIPALPSLA